MARLHLRLERFDDVGGPEGAALFGEHDLEGDVQEQIAEFSRQVAVVSGPDRVRDFVRLLEEIRAERLRRLLRVPRTADAQEADEREDAGEGIIPFATVFRVETFKVGGGWLLHDGEGIIPWQDAAGTFPEPPATRDPQP